MSDRLIRISLDINVLVADLLGTIKGRKGTAARYLVDAVRNGECDAGPAQLITSVPVIENWANVLMRLFNYDKDSAEETAWLLHDYALEGPLALRPSIIVGAGHIPFASEEEELAAARTHLNASSAKLFDEITDDRHVLLGAIGGEADLLATNDVDDFHRGPAQSFSGRDVMLFPTAASSLVIGRPSFLAFWLRQGVIPDAVFLADHVDELSIAGWPGNLDQTPDTPTF
jgi:hypothetical protein